MVQPRPQHVVIIGAASISRHPAPARRRVLCFISVVIHPDHYDAAHFGQNGRGVSPRLRVALHVLHLAGKTLFEPSFEAFKAVGLRRRRNSHQLKSQRRACSLIRSSKRSMNPMISRTFGKHWQHAASNPSRAILPRNAYRLGTVLRQKGNPRADCRQIGWQPESPGHCMAFQRNDPSRRLPSFLPTWQAAHHSCNRASPIGNSELTKAAGEIGVLTRIERDARREQQSR